MTTKKFTQILTDRLNQETIDHNEFLTIVEIMKPFEGKRIDKNMEKKLPEGYRLTTDSNGYHIVFNERKHFLGYFSQGNQYSEENFSKCDAPYNAGAKERAEKLKYILENKEAFDRDFKHFVKIEKAIKLMAEIKKENKMHTFSYHNPATYEITNFLLSSITDTYLLNDLKRVF